MSGRSVAIWLWQIMQVFTLGIPAIGPFSTLSWQSVQTACFSICVLCGNGIGWTAAGRMLKKSRVAALNVGRAGVYTDVERCAGWLPHAATFKAHTAITARLKPRVTATGRAARVH